MKHHKLNSLSLLMVIAISSCSFNDSNSSKIVCENVFTLTSDNQHRFPDQDDYMQYLKTGYYKTYYRDSTCVFYFEYKNGTIVHDSGTYVIEDNRFVMTFNNIGIRSPYFMVYYPWSNADTHIIDTIKINGFSYQVAFEAKYWETARG